MQDVILYDQITHFDRERVPERVVHAKGSGAFGYFEVTHDITKYTKACIFAEVGKTTPMVVRFSTVAGERGSADTVRDPRGFAMKFYTEEGNWDLVANNTPIFFHRDPILFPSFIHALKRNPATNFRDPNAVRIQLYKITNSAFSFGIFSLNDLKRCINFFSYFRIVEFLPAIVIWMVMVLTLSSFKMPVVKQYFASSI